MVASIEIPKIFVLDASFVLAYLLPDEENDYVKGFFSEYQDRKINFFSVGLLPYEVINGVKSSVIQKRMKIDQAESLVQEFLGMDFTLVKINEKEVLSLALSKDISIYDASYVWLAKEMKSKLLTLDKKLLEL